MKSDQKSYLKASHVKQIDIDEKWLSHGIKMDQSLLTCPVCYRICIDGLVECLSCQRLFCLEDYKLIKETKSQCPMCKIKPWRGTEKIHILYKKMIDQAKYRCQLCSSSLHNTSDSFDGLEALKKHLEAKHNCILDSKGIIYKYSLQFDDGKRLKLTLHQNVYLNQMKNENVKRVYIGDEGFERYDFYLDKMKGIHSVYGSFTLIQEPGQDVIQKSQQYFIWEIELDGKIIMYKTSMQNILEIGFQRFQANRAKNEIHYDNDDIRYRISFKAMLQINTSTDFQRSIRRKKIVFK